MAYIRVFDSNDIQHLGHKLEVLPGTTTFRLWTGPNTYTDFPILSVAEILPVKNRYALDNINGVTPTEADV